MDKMQELVQDLMHKANLNEGQAQSVVSTVMGFLSKNVPQLSGILSMAGLGGAAATAGSMAAAGEHEEKKGFFGGIMDKIGDVFDGDDDKKDAAASTVAATTHNASNSAADAGAAVAGAAHAAGGFDMGSLVSMVSQHANLDQMKAQLATSTLLGSLKEKVPQAAGILDMIGIGGNK